MIRLNDYSFHTLVNSDNCVHLSAYIENEKDPSLLKEKLQKVVIDSSKHLMNALTPDELKSFLAPIDAFIKDTEIQKKFIGNIAIFRKRRSLKILSIPSDVKDLCVVADTFHIKPILKWLQHDDRYILMGLTNRYINFYSGKSPDSIRHLSTKLISESSSEEYLQENIEDIFNDFILENPTLNGHKLFIAGKTTLFECAFKNLNYVPTYGHNVYPRFSTGSIDSVQNSIKMLLSEEKLVKLENSMKEYNWAKKKKQTQENIFDICKSAIKGEVKKLIIKDEHNIFGRICNTTGDLSIHFSELNHLDDDILDDLAQTVIKSGGEVVIADKSLVESQGPAVAILNNKKVENEIHIPFMLLGENSSRFEDLKY